MIGAAVRLKEVNSDSNKLRPTSVKYGKAGVLQARGIYRKGSMADPIYQQLCQSVSQDEEEIYPGGK